MVTHLSDGRKDDVITESNTGQAWMWKKNSVGSVRDSREKRGAIVAIENFELFHLLLDKLLIKTSTKVRLNAGIMILRRRR